MAKKGNNQKKRITKYRRYTRQGRTIIFTETFDH